MSQSDADVWKGIQAGTADVVRQIELENAKLKGALQTITRMKLLPDDVMNRMTLLAAIHVAEKALS